MGRTRPAVALGLILALGLFGRAAASGDGITAPWYLDPYGGDAKDQASFFHGRLGVLMTRTARPRLYMAWRILHGLPVGEEAGAALSAPCCNNLAAHLNATAAEPGSLTGWLDARKLVVGAPALARRPATERGGPDFTSSSVCFDDAIRVAIQTLKDRVRRFGAASPDVKTWLTGQDAVFDGCANLAAQLVELPPNAPGWLRKDRAYQEAALDLYVGRTAQAASRFAAIAKDADSPWRPLGPYLQARALEHEALNRPSPDALAAARQAIAALSRMPDDTPGKGQAMDLSHILAFRFEPAKLLVELDSELLQPTLPTNTDVLFRDYSDLIDQQTPRPELGDWIKTLSARPQDKAAFDYQTPADAKRWLYLEAQSKALDHARERWTATHDPAWLLAALSLADPGAADARALAKDGAKVKPGYPGWLTIQYHLIRLGLPTAEEAVLRRRLDAVLARKDLSANDRNLFAGLRAQVASNPHDFARWALRQRICMNQDFVEAGCGRDAWLPVVQSGQFDQNRNRGSRGLGEDARAVIDRMPLADRIALSKDEGLPALIRMDIALTSFARAVQLQDDRSIDGLADEIAPLLPQMADDFRRIPTAKPGPDKRFAVAMIMAKIPGLRVDLVDYVRPSGRVADFQRHWMDWRVLPAGRGQASNRPPVLAAYQEQGVMPQGFSWQARADHAQDALMDMTCLGECAPAAQPLHLPAFVRERQSQARTERAFFVQRADTEEGIYNPATQKLEPVPEGPSDARDLWDEMLDYAKAHPNDPRMPEALHWIVHASHFGASHDHSGRRAFRMLQLGYPKSVWAKHTPSYSE